MAVVQSLKHIAQGDLFLARRRLAPLPVIARAAGRPRSRCRAGSALGRYLPRRWAELRRRPLRSRLEMMSEVLVILSPRATPEDRKQIARLAAPTQSIS